MTLRTTLTTVLLAGLMAPAAFAQAPVGRSRSGQAVKRQPSIALRQHLQQKRIGAAQRRGALSDAERQRLTEMRQHLRTRARELRASDGRLTLRERMQLHRELNRISRAIRRAGKN